MHVGIAGPVTTAPLLPYLEGEPSLPLGMGGTAVTALVLGLLKAGHRVSVYALDPAVDSEVHAKGPQLTLHIGAYRPRARARAADFFRAERRAVARFVRDDPAEVINAQWTYEFALGALAARRDTLVTVRDWSPRILASSRDLYRAIRFLMDRRCLRSAESLACTSPYLHGLLARRGREAFLVPNMVSQEVLKFGAKSARGGRTIVSVANGFGGWKNVEAVLAAVTHLRDAELVLVGSGTEPGGEADLAAQRLGVRDRVRLLGPLSHYAALKAISEADVMVHPSLEESFGNVLVEAMALGVPVIGGERSGAVPWVLADGRAGLLTNVRDPALMAESVERVLGSAAVWSQYSTAGRERVRTTFSEEAVVAGCVKVYQRLVAE